MNAPVQIAPDLAIGQENPAREYGSRILNRWLAERRRKQAAARPARRHYAAAAQSRLNSGWSSQPQPSAWHIWQALQALRARSREQYRNNDYARRFVRMCKNNIVGPNGIVLQARVTDPDGTPDRLASEAIEQAWRDWSLECDAAGQLTLAEMERLIIATVAIDGEVLVRRVPAGAYGFRLQLIDPELLDIRLNGHASNGNRIRMGVEMDKAGRPVAYHLLEEPADLYQSSYRVGGRHERVPAEDMIHLYLHEAIGQTRGVPWMASALVRMKHLSAYEEAAVVAARVGASKMGFFKASEPADASQLADDEDLDTGEFIQEADPGAFDVLPEGYDFVSFNPDYPHQQFGDFVKATLRGIASGLGVAYNALANDLEGVNYSSIRAGVLEEREEWKVLQNWLIDHFMRPVYLAWLDTQLALGTIKVPTKAGGMKPLDPARVAKYRAVTFQARRWAWVDPQKDMAAAEQAIALGVKSRSEIIRDMGRDPDEVWNEIARENELLKGLGIAVDGEGQGGDGARGDVKQLLDAYGIGVRSGVITPQKADEDTVRDLLGMPEASSDVEQAWENDGGVRRPVTLKSGEAFDAEQAAAASDNGGDA